MAHIPADHAQFLERSPDRGPDMAKQNAPPTTQQEMLELILQQRAQATEKLRINADTQPCMAHALGHPCPEVDSPAPAMCPPVEGQQGQQWMVGPNAALPTQPQPFPEWEGLHRAFAGDDRRAAYPSGVESAAGQGRETPPGWSGSLPCAINQAAAHNGLSATAAAHNGLSATKIDTPAMDDGTRASDPTKTLPRMGGPALCFFCR